jgi:ubiquinone/menaquinone biosynthesis C-methylase UbiE
MSVSSDVPATWMPVGESTFEKAPSSDPHEGGGDGGSGMWTVDVPDVLRKPFGPPGELRWQAHDDAWHSYLDGNAVIPHRWLLIQTMVTSVMRRHILGMLGVRPGWRTLDIGTGFGPIPMELAALEPIEAFGVDVDPSVLSAADRVRIEVEGRGGLHTGSVVNFSLGDAYGLTHSHQSIDLVTARFVFQHLRHHHLAISEMARVVKPGGLACVIDVDDGLSVTHPEPSSAYRLLADAVSAMQTLHGGGRDVARRMPAMLDRGGFEIRAVLALPDAEYRSSGPGDVNRMLLLDRFLAARGALIGGGFLASDEFDGALEEFSAETIAAECIVVTHLAVIGERRPPKAAQDLANPRPTCSQPGGSSAPSPDVVEP